MTRTARGAPYRREEDAPPSSLPDVAPPHYRSSEHSFSLQMVMELQKSVSELSTKVNRLVEDSKAQGDKIDRVAEKVDNLRMWAASIIGGSAVIWFLIWAMTMWRQEIAAWLVRP